MSIDLPKYISSMTNAFASSIKNGVPSLLRGSQDSRQTSVRKTSIRKNRNSDPALELQHQQQLLPKVLSSYNEASIHSLTIDDNESNDITTLDQQTTRPRESTKLSYSDDSTSQEQDNLHFGLDEKDSILERNDRISEDTSGNNTWESAPIRSKKYGATNRPKVLCLSGDSYGRTMNQYLQLATILHQLGINGSSVVAFKNPLFTSFYKTWFEPRDDIIVKYDDDAPCDAEYDAVTLHYMFFADKWKQVAYQFKTLVPKASIKEEAERVMKDYAGSSNVPITTVHRRDLEGACVLFAENKNLIACPNIQSSLEMSTAEYKDACLIDYPMIANATNGSSVILFTDGQVPALDETFPFISKHSFPVQSWMMAISNVHYGNPFSTVDLVVYFWRLALAELNGNDGDDEPRHMQPSACYKPTPLMSSLEKNVNKINLP